MNNSNKNEKKTPPGWDQDSLSEFIENAWRNTFAAFHNLKTWSAISSSLSLNLIIRAADVCLKERRKLVLMVRETPLHLGHLRSMVNVSEIGAIVMPPVPAFYTNPESVDDIVNYIVGRALSMFGLDTGMVKRWGEDIPCK